MHKTRKKQRESGARISTICENTLIYVYSKVKPFNNTRDYRNMKYPEFVYNYKISQFYIKHVYQVYKRPLGRPRRRWEDNIRMDLEEIGMNTRNWVHSAQDRDYCRALVNPD